MPATLCTVAYLAGLPVLFFAAFFVAPMVAVAVASFTTAGGEFTFAHYARILLDRYHWDVLWVTFRIGALTTIVSVLIGYPLAWYLVRLVHSDLWRRICV